MKSIPLPNFRSWTRSTNSNKLTLVLAAVIAAAAMGSCGLWEPVSVPALESSIAASESTPVSSESTPVSSEIQLESNPEEEDPGPWYYSHLSPEGQEIYQLLEDGAVTEDQPYLFPEPLDYRLVSVAKSAWTLDHLYGVGGMMDALILPVFTDEFQAQYGDQEPYSYEIDQLVVNRQPVDGTGIVKGLSVCFPRQATDEEVVWFEEEANRWLAQLPGEEVSEYDRVKAMVELICAEADYMESGGTQVGEAWGLIVEKQPICSGYARGVQYLAKRLGLDCVVQSGAGMDDIAHAWNRIRVDGDWYQLDVTWMDQGGVQDINWQYFLISDEQMALDHQWEPETNDPALVPPAAPASWEENHRKE